MQLSRKGSYIWEKEHRHLKKNGYFFLLSLEILKIVFVKGPVWGRIDRVLSRSSLVIASSLWYSVIWSSLGSSMIESSLGPRWSSLGPGSSDLRILSRTLSPLFPVCLLEMAVWITAEQDLLLKVTAIMMESFDAVLMEREGNFLAVFYITHYWFEFFNIYLSWTAC